MVVLATAPDLRAQETDSSLAKHVTRVKTPVKHAAADTVGVVNGVVITYGDFKLLLSGTINDFVGRTGVHVVTDSVYSQLVDTAWSRAMIDIIEVSEINNRKLSLTDSGVIALLLEHPPEYLRKQFTDSVGAFHKDYLSIALNDPRNDTTVRDILAGERIRLESERLVASVTRQAKSDSARERTFKAWLRRTRMQARIIDRRMNFGFY